VFYINKDKKVIELIYSEPGICIIIDQEETLSTGTPTGRILKIGKRDLKRNFKKCSGKNIQKYVKVKKLGTEEKKNIIETFTTDKIGLLNYTEDYIDGSNKLDRKEYFDKLSDEDYRKTLKELQDLVVKAEQSNE